MGMALQGEVLDRQNLLTWLPALPGHGAIQRKQYFEHQLAPLCACGASETHHISTVISSIY